MNQIVEVLKAARNLLSNPDHWIKGTLAKNSEGIAVTPLADDAVCWCLEGAIERVAPKFNVAPQAIYEEIRKTLRYGLIFSFNDKSYTTHEDVMKVLSDTIANVSKE